MSTPRKPGEQGDGATRVEPAASAPEVATSKEPAPTTEKAKEPAPKGVSPKESAPEAAASTAGKSKEATPKADEPKKVTPKADEPKKAAGPAASAPADGESTPDTPAGPTPPQRRPVQTPPWQRGQQQRSAQKPASPAPAPEKSGPKTTGPAPVSRPVVTGPAAPKQSKPVVTGTAAPKPAVTGTSAPQQSRPVVTGTAAPKAPAPKAPAPQAPASGKPVVTGTAAPKAPAPQASAARSKAAALDGPTRSIARPELAKDMPDLSEVKHPTPAGGVRKVAPSAIAVPAPAEGAGLRATVQLRRIDPWSALKVSLVISVALFFVWMVAVGLLYVVLDGMGVWDRLNNAFTEIVTDSSTGGLVSSGQVFGYSALVGLMNVVLFTALSTIGSFIYNLCSDLVGGVQVTLADPD